MLILNPRRRGSHDLRYSSRQYLLSALILCSFYSQNELTSDIIHLLPKFTPYQTINYFYPMVINIIVKRKE